MTDMFQVNFNEVVAQFSRPKSGDGYIRTPRDLYVKILALRMLSRWSGDFSHDSLLSEVFTRELFPSSKLPKNLTLLKKWNEEEARQKEEGVYVFVSPRKILQEQDVKDYVEACHEVFSIPREFPDHPNLALLSEILDVSDIEREALNHALLRPTAFDTSAANYVYSRVLAHDEMKSPEKAYSFILGWTTATFREFSKSSLRKTAVLIPPSNQTGLYVINSVLHDLFVREGVTSQYIEDTLFPSSVTTELKVSDYPHVSKETTRVVNIVNRSLESGKPGNNILLWGAPGTGKTELALALAKEQGWKLRVIGDISADDDSEKSRSARIASLKLAFKLLARDKGAVLLFDEMEDLFKTDNNAAFSKAFINRLIETAPIPVIWTTNSLDALEHSSLRRMVYNINLENPPQETREIIWKKYCRDVGLRLSPSGIKKMAASYEIAPALIKNAVSVAYAVVGAAKGKRAEDEVEEIVASLDRLVSLGKVRSPNGEDKRYPYDMSCVNSETNIEQLTQDILAAKPRWSLCLFGAPGTGKSEYGRHLAEKLGKKLVLKRASDLMSMWVGGTEKNIAEAFRKAKVEKHVLLIDEGDSFLRNRELAKNSWEITAVNEMLSQMERHDQPFILTTNLMADLDSAALRRFTFKLKFEFLSPDQAKRLFLQYFGVEAPKAIEKNHMLAPGDFANVKGQVDIRNITDAERIYALLKSETDLKPQVGKSIGF